MVSLEASPSGVIFVSLFLQGGFTGLVRLSGMLCASSYRMTTDNGPLFTADMYNYPLDLAPVVLPHVCRDVILS